MVFGWAFKLAYYTYVYMVPFSFAFVYSCPLFRRFSFFCSFHFRPHSFHIIIIIRRINFLLLILIAIVTFAHSFFSHYLPEAIRRPSSTHLHHWHKRTLEILISTILFVSMFLAIACEPQQVCDLMTQHLIEKKYLMQCNVNRTHLLKCGNRNSILPDQKKGEHTSIGK